MKKIFKKIVVAIMIWEARVVIKKNTPKIIAITGSVGKTTTKDAIYAALQNSFNVRRSPKSFNSEIGIPLTILGLPNQWSSPIGWFINILKGFILVIKKSYNYPEVLVLEVGADRPGDIESVTKWLHPDISVITRFGTVPVHVEYFDSPEEVIREKSFLARKVKKNGTLVLNADDENVLKMQKLTDARIVTYAENTKATIRGSYPSIGYTDGKPCGISFKLEYEGKIVPVRLKNVLGKHHIYAGLSAIAVGLEMGVNLVDLIANISSYAPPMGRLRLIEGVNGSSILDDSYNSSPIALSAALDTLDEIETEGRKYAILGDMLELGKFTKSEHKKIGEKLGLCADEVYLIGKNAQYFQEGALSSGMLDEHIHICDNASEAGVLLKEKLKRNDIVLVKGSQSTRSEKAIIEIMLYPENKNIELVRQEVEWETR